MREWTCEIYLPFTNAYDYTAAFTDKRQLPLIL